MGRAPITLLALVCAALLAGCGADNGGTIQSADADALILLLDTIEDDLAAGDCELAAGHAAEFVDAVNGLPSEVDNDVQGALTQSATRMVELSGDPAQCEQGVTGEDVVAETTSTATEETTSSTTSTTEEQTTDDEEPEEQVPDDGGEGADGGESDDEPVEEEAPAEPEVEIGPTDSGGIDLERRGP